MMERVNRVLVFKLLGVMAILGQSLTIAAIIAAEPALSEPLSPLPEGDTTVIDATVTAALLTAPHVETSQSRLDAELSTKVATVAVSQLPPATTIVPYAEIVSGVALPETAPSVNTHAGAETAQASPVTISDVQVEETANGFTLQLEADGELPTPTTSVTGNAAIANISNAMLQLPDGDEFFASDPAEGISLINVTTLPDNQVQIAITGTDAPPTINISIDAAGLTVSGTPGDTSVQLPDDETIQITVTGQGDDDYFVPNASTATRTDTPLRDVPNSIQVIPRQIIEDQQALRIEEVLENAAGVTFLGNQLNRGVEVGIRGFTNTPILRDGFILPGAFAAGDFAEPEVNNLERVEVLRGPASLLYGLAEPGGVINLVTKRPLSEPYYNVQLQVGSRGLISPSIDLSGPLTEDGRLLYRLNALYRQEEGFRDYDNDFERFFIGSSLTWLISDSTDLTFNLEYTEDRDPYVVGIPASGDGVVDIPLERVINSPRDIQNQDYLNVGYTLEHRFSDSWRLRNRFSYVSSSYGSEIPITFPLFFIDEPNGILERFFFDAFGENTYHSLYTNIQGEFNTGSVKHTLLFGVDFSRFEGSFETRISDFGNPDHFSTINIFDPNYFAVPVPSVDNLVLIDDGGFVEDQLGLYVQDQIDILDNLILVAGLRYSTVDRESTNNLANTVTNQYDDAVTPRIGIVYQPIEPISLYANYARSFVPNTGIIDVSGGTLPPEEGVGFEVGIRGEIIQNRLVATLAYFDITKQNVATDDPTTTLPGSIAVGEQRSQGVDFNLTGEILPGWNIVASYAYIDAAVTEDTDTTLVGSRLVGVPEHSASLWTTYEIQSGEFEGLGFGLGVNFLGERWGGLPNTFKVDSNFLTNAAIFYRRDNWQARLNIDNLFNVDNFSFVRSARETGIYPGASFTVRASISYEF